MSVPMNKMTNRQLMDRFFPKSRRQPEVVGETTSGAASSSKPVEESSNVQEPSSSTSTHLFYAVVRNIPSEFRSKDLRDFFSDFVETNRIDCFHFRHRPEVQVMEDEESTEGDAEAAKPKTCCCLVRFAEAEHRREFLDYYHGKRWTHPDGSEMRAKCVVHAIKTTDEKDALTEAASSASSQDELSSVIEMKPPALMPHGNVGTPSEYFRELIRACKLPASLIPKLGIKQTRRKRKYESLKMDYGEKHGKTMSQFLHEKRGREREREELRRKEAEDATNIQGESAKRSAEDSSDDEDKATEDWERYEALYDDVTEQDRTKEKKYEEEMEVVWEKGGPGLVWKMDKSYWDEIEKGTDCDWAWADDWDVDYSIYYEGKAAGDIDARAAVEMREDDMRRKGNLQESVFRQPQESQEQERIQKSRRRRMEAKELAAGSFEAHTRRIGSKLLTRMGWAPGSGLGRNEQGHPETVARQLEEDGRVGGDRGGLGYYGEKRAPVARPPERHMIASIYDEATDKGTSDHLRLGAPDDASSELLQRRSEPTKMKYR